MTKSIRNALKELYLECFDDSAACADVIFSTILKEENARYVENDGEIAAALHIVEKKLNYKGASFNLPFFMGISTSKKHRGKGLASNLITKALNELDAAFVMLYPAIKGFYERLNFTTVAHTFDFSGYEHGKNLGADELLSMYNSYARKKDFYIEKTYEDFQAHLLSDLADGGCFTEMKERGTNQTAGFYDGTEGLLFNKVPEIPSAMARLVSVKRATEMILNLPLKIKLIDPLIEKNNITFYIENGKLTECGGFDVEMTNEEFTRTVFGLGEYKLNLDGFIYDKY